MSLNFNTAVEPSKKWCQKCASCEMKMVSLKPTISIPGLDRLFDPSYGTLTKIIWSIIIIMNLIVCVILTIKQLEKYFDYPIASQTVIEREVKNINFPTFYICSTNAKDSFQTILKEIQHKCNSSYKEICNKPLGNSLLSDFNISLDSIWKNNDINILVDGESQHLKIQMKTKFYSLGSCTIINQTEASSQSTVHTKLKINVHTADTKKNLYFMAHASTKLSFYEFELFNYKIENLELGYKHQYNIHKEIFNRKNITDRPCSDITTDKEMDKQFLDELIILHTCRLPFLAKNFLECLTLNDVESAMNKTSTAIDKILKNFGVKHHCHITFYSIGVESILPLNQTEENFTTTQIIVRFADETCVTITEYFSYNFPDLISDLFAYWGFFLCLSALVFVEIIEFFIAKLNSIFNYIK